MIWHVSPPVSLFTRHDNNYLNWPSGYTYHAHNTTVISLVQAAQYNWYTSCLHSTWSSSSCDCPTKSCYLNTETQSLNIWVIYVDLLKNNGVRFHLDLLCGNKGQGEGEGNVFVLLGVKLLDWLLLILVFGGWWLILSWVNSSSIVWVHSSHYLCMCLCYIHFLSSGVFPS